MEEFKDVLENNKREVLIAFVIIVIVIGGMIFVYISLNNKIGNMNIETPTIIEEEVQQEVPIIFDKYVFVDIKGEVKKPGVYKVLRDDRVQDVIKLAGGLTKNANTTPNNLSLKVSDEMLIIIYSNNQIKNITKVKEEEQKIQETCINDKNDSCIKTETNIQSSKININTATKEQLMNLPSIGESQANSIITYRKENGNFKDIKDITNVTGIGDSIYTQIKDLITI